MAQKRYKPKFESTAIKFGKLKEMDMDPSMDDSGSETSGMENEFGTENLQWDNEEDARPSEDMFESKRAKKKRYVRKQDGSDSSEEDMSKEEDDKEKEDMKEMIKELSKQVSILSKKIKEADDSKDMKDDEGKKDDAEEESTESDEEAKAEDKKEESVSGFSKIFRETKAGPGLL